MIFIPLKYLYMIILLSFAYGDGQGQIDTTEKKVLFECEEGYSALYGEDLSQWKGQLSEDPREIPEILEGLSETDRQQKQEEVDQKTFEHWYVQDGMILYDGTEGVGNIETEEAFGDFELILDWKIGPKGDSGIFPRNIPQVQIWDPHHQGVGSGGLHNNNPRVDPITTADKPVGEWNKMRIRMVGDSVWVTLNDELVIDKVVLDNLWAEYEQSVPSQGPIVLQSHGTPLWFRNACIKELN